ncbi:MAG: OsmC family protein [Bryobacteraceae bacterium]
MRQIPAGGGLLIGDATGEVETEDKVLVIRRVHVRLQLQAAEEHRETAERVHAVFHDRCPVYRTLKSAIAITTSLEFQATDG